ncbi:phage/plasmid primase, P4 family [Campylobacter sp. RM16192]|uniref:phage/plasmid primase, P4 family n=1 Tax=Campylobacter sp. RM16192 TaxID=1660080 RepID=UPI001451BEAC|nr:phage/plasmid primase, P4 family [Campylobacter sp. RM16192]QCD52487.1 phage-associated DNA primase [Campylobacter sp. RM16192]
MDNIFQTIKQTVSKEQFKDFVTSIYGMEFRGTNAFCPFHDHNRSTPSLGITSNGDGAFFKCFACNTSGDIVKFIELKEQLSPTQAAKKVCDFFNIPNNINVKAMSEEERAAYEAHQKLMREENEARLAKEAAEKEKRVKNLKFRLAKTAPELLLARKNNYDLLKDKIEDLFPAYFSQTFEAYSKELLGYDMEQKSFVVIIRDEKGEPVNFKYRQKFRWDKEAKTLTSERMPGKWIGEADASAYPFPISYFKAHTDDRVIICEGEKDALNLLSFDVNVLTLGGVTASFEPHKELLRDKHVYIWFDHDEAGYKNAIKKFYELKDIAKSVQIVLFYAIAKNLPHNYDISDFIASNMPRLATNPIFDLIAFSCFKPTNAILDEICEYYPEARKEFEAFKQKKIVKYFDEVTNEFLARDENGNYINIFPVKGELDDEYIDSVLDNAKALKKSIGSERYECFKNEYLKNFLVTEVEEERFDRFAKAFDEAFKISSTLRKNYHQTHIIDMVASFESSLYKLGYHLAQYQNELYFWTGTHYARLNLTTLSNFLQNVWMNIAYVDTKKRSVNNSKEIIENLVNKAYVLDHIKRDEQRRIINLLNGTIFISKNGHITFKTHHDIKDGALNILEFKYDKDAKCPKWDKFLKDVMSDEDDIKTLMEFIGYCFLPSHDFESFLFLYGKSGANGKSVILDTIRNFFGEDNVSSLQLQQFEGHQLYGLANKLINIGSEIDKNGTDKGQMANLKALVSTKDSIMINPKNEKPFNLMPNEKPKLAFAGNEKPRQGIDNGVFRRMVLISFDKEVKDSQKIRGLSERFNDEMAGIFNLALSGLKRLITQGKFTRSKRMLAELEEYKDEVNPIRAFVRDAIVADENYMVPNKYLYGVYKSFIEEKGGTPLKEKNFFRALRDECLINNIVISGGQKRLQKCYVGLTNDRPYCTFGIKLNSNLDFDTVNFGGQAVMIESMSIYQANGAKADV